MTPEKFAILLKLYKIQPTGVLPPALYNEYCKGELVQGYMQISNYDYAWHIWVEKDDMKIDMNKILYTLYNPEYKNFNIPLITKKPEKFDKVDHLIQEWDLYNNDPAKFWNLMPHNVKKFKSKYINGNK